ncbi:hypothetical protein MMPV_006898 [Pyropia vietnamensis]
MMSDLPALSSFWDLGLPSPSVSAELTTLLDGAPPPPLLDLDDLWGNFLLADPAGDASAVSLDADTAVAMTDVDADADADPVTDEDADANVDAAAVSEALLLATPPITAANEAVLRVSPVTPVGQPSPPPPPPAVALSRPTGSRPQTGTTPITDAFTSPPDATKVQRGPVHLSAAIIQRAVGRAAAAALGRLLATAASSTASEVSPPAAPSCAAGMPTGALRPQLSTGASCPPLPVTSPAGWTSPLMTPAGCAAPTTGVSPNRCATSGTWPTFAAATPPAAQSPSSGGAPACSDVSDSTPTVTAGGGEATPPPMTCAQLDGALRAVALDII